MSAYNLSFGQVGHGYMIRTFSEDIFNPKLVPNYVKNISVRYILKKRKNILLM